MREAYVRRDTGIYQFCKVEFKLNQLVLVIATEPISFYISQLSLPNSNHLSLDNDFYILYILLVPM